MTSIKHNQSPFFTIFKDASKPIICMSSMNARLTNMLAARYASGDGPLRVLAIDPSDMMPEVCTLLDDFVPDVLRGTSSLVARLVQGLSLSALRGIVGVWCASEILTEQQSHMISKRLPNVKIDMVYALVELGAVSGTVCRHLKRNQYHPRQGIYIDIENADESGAGEVFISGDFGGDPIEKYRPGDVARFLPPCPCGEQVTFELIGRTGRDYVKLLGTLLRREEFDRVRAALAFLKFDAGDQRVILALLAAVLVCVAFSLPRQLGRAKASQSLKEFFAKSRSINLMAAARVFLFGSRDVWFVVGLPVFLYSQGWRYMEVAGFIASWTIGYGLVQAAAPSVIRRSADGLSREVPEARLWGAALTAIPLVLALLLGHDQMARLDLVVVFGLCAFGFAFAVISSLHSYLILAYAGSAKAAEDVGFYYAANAAGRLMGILLSGALAQAGGLAACLWASAVMLALCLGVTFLLPTESAPRRLPA